jgi:8-oxo-dGTP pyrophosphatase MutT (NUDIX family)
MIRQFCAGGLVYKKENSETLFLICKSSNPLAKSPWCLPKGWLDDDPGDAPGPRTLGKIRATPEEVEASALREVCEEGGVEAKIISRLGSEKFMFTDDNKQLVFKFVTFFLMAYIRDIPEGFGSETSEIRWVKVDEAAELLKKRKGEYELIVKAQSLIK